MYVYLYIVFTLFVSLSIRRRIVKIKYNRIMKNTLSSIYNVVAFRKRHRSIVEVYIYIYIYIYHCLNKLTKCVIGD